MKKRALKKRAWQEQRQGSFGYWSQRWAKYVLKKEYGRLAGNVSPGKPLLETIQQLRHLNRS